MQFPDGFTDVEPGKLATVVTNLEMWQKPILRDVAIDPWMLRLVKEPDLDWYRDIFRRIGEPYLWMSRLRMDDETLRRIVHHPAVEVFALDVDGRDEGMVELDFREAGECELAFFGVTERLIGSRAARAMMNHAIARAWSRPIERFWVHTCTLDHPKAVPFYMRSGFVPFKLQVEILDDPRLIGVLPRDAAPNVPMFVKQ